MTRAPIVASPTRGRKFLHAAGASVIAAIAALPLPIIVAGPAAAERGDVPGTSNGLKVLRRDGNYLVCKNADGTDTVYKLKSVVRR